MAASITIKVDSVSEVTASLFGSTSTVTNTSFTWNSSTNTGTFSYDGTDSSAGPTITYLPFIDYSTNSSGTLVRYNNSVCLQLQWAGGKQSVVLSGNVRSATWKRNGTNILPTANTSYSCPAGAALTVTPVKSSSAVSSSDYVSKVTIGGYWETGVGPIDGADGGRPIGSYSDPVSWAAKHTNDQTTRRVPLSWQKPDSSSINKIQYYIIVGWKGNWGANIHVATSFICSPNASSVLDSTNWWTGAETVESGNPGKILYTVHAVYSDKGVVPTLEQGQSQNINRTRPNWGIWRQFKDHGKTLITLRFYDYNNGSPTLLKDATTGESEFTALSGKSKISSFIPDSGFPKTSTGLYKVVDYWLKKNHTTSSYDTSTHYSTSNLGTAPTYDVDIAGIFKNPAVTITFNANGGTVGGSATTTRTWDISSTQTLLTPTAYSKTGYTVTFAGWYTAASGGTLIGAAGASYTVPENAVTMYAHWTESINSYTLTTAVASSSSGMGTVSGGGSKAYNSSVTVTATANNGYQFVKWVFTGSKTGESTTASTTFNMPAGSVTATAHFEARTFTLSFNAKTENYPKSSDDGGQEVTNPSSLTVTYNQKYPTLPSYNNTDFDGWKWDYTFGGWWTDAPVDGVAQGTRVYGNTASELYTTVGNQTLYAFWPRTQKKYNITWIEADLYDNLVLEQDNNVLADTAPSFDQANPVHEGYEFLGWTPVGKDQTGYPKEESQLPVVMETLTYKAVYEPISNHIIFDCQGGTPATFDPVLFNVETVPVVINSTSGGPYEITKVGYKFLGWLPFVNGEPISDTPQLVYRLTDWVDSDITLVAKYIAALSAFNPKPGDPGFDESNPDEDNDNYGIPISALDRNQKYKLKLHVDGDRTSDPVFDISEGVITKVNGVWVWDYESDILTITELEELLSNTVFVMDIWRCIVFRTTGVIKVTLETYDTDGTYLGYDDMDSPFELYDWMTPYIDGENSIDDNSDVVPVESISSIENLDLWANGLEQRFTKRFIGNGKSTISVIMTAHSKDEEHGEVLYGAVPTVYCVLLKSDDSNGGETYELKYVNSVETQSDYDALFNSSDIDDISYTTKELPVNYNPFPNIQHNASKDYINATLKVRVYDSRHMQPLFDD